MARIPSVPAPDPAVLGAPRTPLFTAEIHVVTPMFGGGALPGAADPDLLVRGATIRGHLRFWWRACRAGQFTDVDQLYAAESRIWGQATGTQGGGPSALELTVTVLAEGVARPCARGEFSNSGGYRASWQLGPGTGALPYVLWPFQGEAGQGTIRRAPAMMREGLRFRLTCTLAAHAYEWAEEVRREVRAALWAWVNFGGLGARTRRGCGALFSPELSVSESRPAGVAEQLRAGAQQLVTRGARRIDVPALHGAVALLGSPGAPLERWNQAVDWLRQFRQGVGLARNPGSTPNRPGRSRWPEADSIRERLRLPDSRHPPQHPARPLYPRADLGLPIVFQQMVGGPYTLEAAKQEATRFASPIIIKPLAIAPDRALPLALLLEAPHIWELSDARLDGQSVARAELYDPTKSTQVEPMQRQGTAREAFRAYVRDRPGVTEVRL